MATAEPEEHGDETSKCGGEVMSAFRKVLDWAEGWHDQFSHPGKHRFSKFQIVFCRQQDEKPSLHTLWWLLKVSGHYSAQA